MRACVCVCVCVKAVKYQCCVWNVVAVLIQECISQSALITKFAHHVSNATVIVSDLRKLWEEEHNMCQRRRLLQYFATFPDLSYLQVYDDKPVSK